MNSIQQAQTHVQLNIDQPNLFTRFVPDGMQAWHERSQQLAGTATEARSHTLARITLADDYVFTGTLGLAFCNPLSDGIQALNFHDAAEGSNVHRPGSYTQLLVITDRTDSTTDEGH